MRFNGKRFSMTEDEYQEFDDNCTGLCLACGEERESCEPDAREYKCDVCDKRKCYGVPELLIMGLIDIVEDEDEGEE